MKSPLNGKLQRTNRIFALTLFVFSIFWTQASQAACSIHDHFCVYHAFGATVNTSYPVNATGTSFVMYAIAKDPATGAASTVDFDTKGLMPAMTGDKFLVGSPVNYTIPTGPYIVNSTAYGTANPPPDWKAPGDGPLQVYPSQYQLTFNQNTAVAKHTGDFNGGENGNIPGATGCPNMPGAINCEAVVVTGNVPSGFYEQKVRIFNFQNVPNPQVQLQVGAYATGRAVIVNNSHESTEQAYFTILSGTGASTPAYQYEVYNRDFDPHANGVAVFDQNKYSTRYGATYDVGDHRFRNAYFTTLTTHNTVKADGWNDKTYTANTVKEKQYMGEVPKPPAPNVFCTDGKSSIACSTPGAVEYGSAKGRALENAYATLWADQAQQRAALESAKEFAKLTNSEKASMRRKQTLELASNTIARWDADGSYIASGIGVVALSYGILEDKVLSSFSGQPKSLSDYDKYYQQKGGVRARSEFSIGLMNIVPNTADALIGGGIYISQVADAKWSGKSWKEANTQGVIGMETMPKFTNGWNQFTSEYLGADKNSAGQQGSRAAVGECCWE